MNRQPVALSAQAPRLAPGVDPLSHCQWSSDLDHAVTLLNQVESNMETESTGASPLFITWSRCGRSGSIPHGHPQVEERFNKHQHVMK